MITFYIQNKLKNQTITRLIPNAINNFIFERVKAADKSTIVNGIVLYYYAIYDRRFSAL